MPSFREKLDIRSLIVHSTLIQYMGDGLLWAQGCYMYLFPEKIVRIEIPHKISIRPDRICTAGELGRQFKISFPTAFNNFDGFGLDNLIRGIYQFYIDHLAPGIWCMCRRIQQIGFKPNVLPRIIVGPIKVDVYFFRSHYFGWQALKRRKGGQVKGRIEN